MSSIQSSQNHFPVNSNSGSVVTTKLPLDRNSIPACYKWDIDQIYPDANSWNKEFQALQEQVDRFSNTFKNIGKTASDFLNLIRTMHRVDQQLSCYSVYCQLYLDVDTDNQKAIERVAEIDTLTVKFSESCAFFEPQVIALGYQRLQEFYVVEPALLIFDNYFKDLFRQQRYVRNEEVEQVLATAGRPAGGPLSAYQSIVDSDLIFPTARDSKGNEVSVTQGTIHEHLSSTDRTLRETAWKSYFGQYRQFRNTLTAIYVNHIEYDLVDSEVRGYESSIHAQLFSENIPYEVYANTLTACRANAHVWQRIFRLKSQLLGEPLKAWDVHAPLTAENIHIDYDTACRLGLESLRPLGDEYLDIATKGLLAQNWVDVFPTAKKRSSAYSFGTYGTKPYILMNYTGRLGDASDLIHEVGHSVHSSFAQSNQPYCYSDYSFFLAETASTLNQELFCRYLLECAGNDRQQVLSIVEEALDIPHRYLLQMPMLAELELFAHQHIAEGFGLSAELMEGKMLELYKAYYGDGVQLDNPELIAMLWASFSHFYDTAYMFKYATGISAGYQISADILSGDREVLEGYLKMLKAGTYYYPLEAMQLAKVDMLTSKPFDIAFARLNAYADLLESLLSA